MKHDETPSLFPLIVRAARNEAKRLLARTLTFALEYVEEPKTKSRPEEEVDGRHKTIVEAIAATEGAINSVRSETRERCKWLYLVLDDPHEYLDDDGKVFKIETAARTPAEARALFSQPPEAVAVEGRDTRGRHVVAVWDAAKYGLDPTSEPTF